LFPGASVRTSLIARFSYLGSVGILDQLVPVPFARGREAVRIAAWTVGWLVWLLVGPDSLVHALR
jgi:hypothetical protein